MNTEIDREGRFRSLPLRGRLAILVKHLRPWLDSLPPPPAEQGLASPNWWRVIEIGQSACLDELEPNEVREVESLIAEMHAASSRRSSLPAFASGLSDTGRDGLITTLYDRTALPRNGGLSEL